MSAKLCGDAEFSVYVGRLLEIHVARFILRLLMHLGDGYASSSPYRK